MTVAQVRVASGGQAALAHEIDDPDLNPNVLLLRVPYSAGGIELPAFFYFKRGTPILAEVQLRPSKADTEKVLTALQAKYGEPISKQVVERGNFLGKVQFLEYTWSAAEDTIVFSIFAGRGTVKYMPRNAALDSGL
jgi:hypothetical protein